MNGLWISRRTIPHRILPDTAIETVSAQSRSGDVNRVVNEHEFWGRHDVLFEPGSLFVVTSARVRGCRVIGVSGQVR